MIPYQLQVRRPFFQRDQAMRLAENKTMTYQELGPIKPRRVSQLSHLGLIRFTLAIAVVLTHEWQGRFFQGGRHAVVGFFCISGYLITMISRNNYRDRPVAFIFNRALRLYPQYLAALALGVLALLLAPVGAAIQGLQMPTSLMSWLFQFKIIGLWLAGESKLVPTAWSLDTELQFYVVIGLFAARSIWMLGTLLAFFTVLGLGAAFQVVAIPFYGSPLATGFVFLLGATVRVMADRIRIPPVMTLTAMLAFVLNAYWLAPMIETSAGADRLLLVPALLMAVMLAGLPRLRPLGPRMERWADWLGRLSYPVFLSHTAVAGLLGWTSASPGPRRFFVTLAGALMVAVASVTFIDGPVGRLRRRVRSGDARVNLDDLLFRPAILLATLVLVSIWLGMAAAAYLPARPTIWWAAIGLSLLMSSSWVRRIGVAKPLTTQ
jgi:peptidoglycan/LPS O-acetylase OafA/YrhL